NDPGDAPPARQERDRGLIATSVLAIEKPHYPLSVVVTPGPSISIKIAHDCNRYEADAVKQMLALLHCLLESILARPQQPIAQLDLLPETERQQLLYEWNDTAAEYPPAHRIP